jgi:hypothetical protein
MPHPLVIALFRAGFNPAPAARAVRALGVSEEQLSVVTRDHRSQGGLAHELGGSPGAEIEDSRAAGLLAELSADILAAMAIVMPGIGPIIVAGPLAAEFGEVAGHAAGDLRAVLTRAGLHEIRASDWEDNIRNGGVMFAVHASGIDPKRIEKVLREEGAAEVETTLWER